MSSERGIRIANPDEERDDKLFKEVPDVTVEEQEHVPSMLDLDLSKLDKNFKYRWVNVAPLKMARARQRGYVRVDGNEEEVFDLTGERKEISEDGTIRVMDTVLMKVPKGRHRSRRQLLAEKTKTRLGAPRKRFKRKAQDLGQQRYNVPVSVITDKEPKGSRD